MNDQLREAVSALADGEASELELRQILARADDPELRHFWRHCHTARGGVSAAELSFAHIDLSAGIAAAIDEEPAASAPTPRWARPLGGVAVAASVALAVVFGGGALERLPGAVPGAGSAEMAGTGNTTSGRVYPTSGAVSAQGSLPVIAGFPGDWPRSGASVAVEAPDMNEEAQRRLQQYLLRHTERAAANTGQGVLTFARITQIDAE